MNDIANERDRVIGWSLTKMSRRPWYEYAGEVHRRNLRKDSRSPEGQVFIVTWETEIVRVGLAMDNIAVEIETINDAVAESKKTLATLADEVRELSDAIEPELLGAIKRIREARMSAVAEVRDALVALRDIRKFFLDNDYQTEIDRLRAFVNLCNELDNLRKQGVLDAVSDTIIKLSVGEGS
jgi:hypothetical protein